MRDFEIIAKITEMLAGASEADRASVEAWLKMRSGQHVPAKQDVNQGILDLASLLRKMDEEKRKFVVMPPSRPLAPWPYDPEKYRVPQTIPPQYTFYPPICHEDPSLAESEPAQFTYHVGTNADDGFFKNNFGCGDHHD